MSVNLNRRTFNFLLLSTAAVGGAASGAGTDAGPTQAIREYAKNSPYWTKLRYFRRENVLMVWMRVRKRLDGNADVPVTLNLITSRDSKDVLQSAQYTSLASKSHITRAQIILAPQVLTTKGPLYVRLLLGDEQMRGRAFLVRQA